MGMGSMVVGVVGAWVVSGDVCTCGAAARAGGEPATSVYSGTTVTVHWPMVHKVIYVHVPCPRVRWRRLLLTLHRPHAHDRTHTRRDHANKVPVLEFVCTSST